MKSVSVLDLAPSLRTFLEAQTGAQRDKLEIDAIKALRFAWPHRDTPRGSIVIRANVAMLRNLRTWS